MILELYVSLLVAVPIFVNMDRLLRRGANSEDPRLHSWSKHTGDGWVRDHLPIQHGPDVR